MSSKTFVLVALKVSCLVLMVASEDFYKLLEITREASQREIRQAFKKKALKMHPDKNVDDSKAHEKFLQINRAYEVLKDEELRKKYDTYGEEGLKEDAPSGGGYQSWKFYNQEFGLYDDDPAIITLSKSDFEASVQNTGDIWFVNYYSPHCGHCHDLAPAWRELAQELEGVIRIGAVNCGDDWILCREQGIHSYPSLIMYPKRRKFHGDRSKRELMKFALSHVNAEVVELWSGNWKAVMQDKERAKLPWILNVCGDGGDCMQKQNTRKLAASLNNFINVGTLDCHNNEEICTKLGVEHGIFYFNANRVKKGESVEIGSLDAKEVALTALQQLPEVNGIDKDLFISVRKKLEVPNGESPWLVYFMNGNIMDLEMRKLPMMLDTINVGRVDCQQMRTECNNLHIHKFPTFVLFKSGGGHEIHHGRLTAHDVAAFARDSSGTQVVVLGPEDFPGRVIDTQQPWFVDFFAPWCPPCMRLLPEFRKASKQMVGAINFGTVDCTTHVNLCQNYNIRSYPTTIFYNQSQPHHFHGDHSVSSIIEFIEDTLKPPVLILDRTNVKKVLSNKPAEQMLLVDFFAPWCGPCQQLAPEWRKLAKLMGGMSNVKVAQMDCQANGDLCRAQGINSYPAIRLYPIGAVGSHYFHDYNNWFRDVNSLRTWAMEYMPSKVTNLDWDQFQTILKSKEPWIIDFYAPWCGHCQIFAPEFERVATSVQGQVRAGKVNCDNHQHLCQHAGIQAYPTIRFYGGVRTGSSYKQNIYGENIDSQDGDYIIRFLHQRVPHEDNFHDEL